MKQKAGDAATKGRGKTAAVPVLELAYPTPACKVLFSPKAGISRELTRLTQAAAKEISVAAYAFSSKYLGNALAPFFEAILWFTPYPKAALPGPT